jgi:hypothetical protein
LLHCDLCPSSICSQDIQTYVRRGRLTYSKETDGYSSMLTIGSLAFWSLFPKAVKNISEWQDFI